MTSPHRASLVVAAACAFVMGACDGSQPAGPSPLDAKVWDPDIEPSRFAPTITNPYFPMEEGRVFSYRLETADGLETGEVEVQGIKEDLALGVRTRVVRDRVWLNDQLIEETFDWYAQHEDGTVWYFGEYATQFHEGRDPTHDGSWEAGVNGAKPGIIMLGEPEVGERYYQEFYVGFAEDEARVVSLDEAVSVPAGNYQNCIKTRDWTRLEPGSREYKFYCPDVGLVLELSGPSGKERNELVPPAN